MIIGNIEIRVTRHLSRRQRRHVRRVLVNRGRIAAVKLMRDLLGKDVYSLKMAADWTTTERDKIQAEANRIWPVKEFYCSREEERRTHAKGIR